jgi:anti-sigma regulatory factor (Ser/Thr protein kinase)
MIYDMKSRTFPATVESLAPIREYLTELSAAAGLDKKQTYNLCLAVDEVVTNIFLYGYGRSGQKGVVDVYAEVDENQIQITVEDDSPPYDPTQQKLPDEEDLKKPLEERPIGGLGLFLTISNVDEFKYEYISGRNRNIFVVKRLSSR